LTERLIVYLAEGFGDDALRQGIDFVDPNLAWSIKRSFNQI
jgi:hypothetical protein